MRSLLAACLVLCLATQAARADAIQITAAHNVLAEFAKRIGGEDVDVWMPVPEGRDPALWKPAIAEISRIQRSDIILLNGADYSGWAAKTSLPRAKTVITAKAFEDQWIETEGSVTHSHGPDGEHAHTGTDPHTWLDLAQAAAQARAVGEAISKFLPQATKKAEALAAELEVMHNLMLQTGIGIGSPVIASHPRYAYFARAYELEIISLDWAASETPTEEQLATLEALVADSGAKRFLWDATPSEEALEAVADLGLSSIVFDTGAAAGSDFMLSATEAIDALMK